MKRASKSACFFHLQAFSVAFHRQIYPLWVLQPFKHLQQFETLAKLKPHRPLSAIEGHSRTNFPSRVNCSTGLEVFPFVFAFDILSFLVPWLIFLLWLHHSRFSTRLSVLTSLIWLTCGRLSGLGMNAIATRRCTLYVFTFPSLQRLRWRYPYGFFFNLSTCTRPSLR